jgi:hypothetical protein
VGCRASLGTRAIIIDRIEFPSQSSAVASLAKRRLGPNPKGKYDFTARSHYTPPRALFSARPMMKRSSLQTLSAGDPDEGPPYYAVATSSASFLRA